MLGRPRAANLGAAWQAAGAAAIDNPTYGAVSGRVTALAVDPADASGNTIYVGTTGGGVWKSTNAAGPAASVRFTPLTDTTPAFVADGTVSLSIGSLAIGGGVVLAGTGDPNDATDSYYGAGILRSTDGGQTWTLAIGSSDGVSPNRTFAGVSVAAIAFSTKNPLLVVAGVVLSTEGLLVNAGDSNYQFGGIYVSQDAGLTWQVATVMDGTQIEQDASGAGADGGIGATSVVWNPVRQRFYAAMSGHGYYESADGVTWMRLVHQPGPDLTLQYCPTLGGGFTSCPLFRGALAVQPVTGDLFAMTVDINDGDQGLYQDVCGMTQGSCANATVEFGTKLDTAPLEMGSGNAAIFQGTYNLALAASASGSDTLVYVGTDDLYRCSLAAGCALRNTTNAQNGCATPAGVAGAQHAIATLGTSVFLGNDGGLWRSTDGVAETGGVCSPSDAAHFDNLNQGLGSLGEVVGFAQDPVDPATLLAGFGALGTAAAFAGQGEWAQMSTGEGGTVAIDPAHPQNWYVSTGVGVNVGACPKGTGCGIPDFVAPAVGAAQVDGDEALPDAPWMLDPGTTSELLVGTCRVWRGPADGVGWMGSDLLSAPFAAGRTSACGASFGVVRSLGAGGPVDAGLSAPSLGSEVLYAGMAGIDDGGGAIAGHLFTTSSGATAGSSTQWTDASLSRVMNDPNNLGMLNPGRFDISSIAVDPHDPTGATVYATVMGFAGNGISEPHVYRSTDGGGSWTTITRNLPNAPANSVIVDPNDANTVYVAMDTGVYVTRTVTSCTASDCWDVYGVNLPQAPVTQLQAAAGMATGDGRLGELRASTYGRGIWSIPLVTAVSPAAPAMSLVPSTVTFVSQPVGTRSNPATVTVTNSGNATLTVTTIATTADYVETDTCVGSPVPMGGSCTVAVSFEPAATGTRNGLLTLYGNVAGGQATATLTGVGTAPASVVLMPLQLDFGSVEVGSTSAARSVTVSNVGGTATSVQSISVSGDYTIAANSCGGSLAAGVGCTVSLEFVPIASGVRSGTLTLVDGVGTQVANLTGTGVNPATDALAPLALTFAPQVLNSTSAAQAVTLSNAGDLPLSLITAATSGDFTVVNGCGTSLAGHASCSFEVAYVPKKTGPEMGMLTVGDVYRMQSVPLTGSGVAPAGVSLSPAGGLTFAATAVGEASAAQTVTLTNNGGLSLALNGIAATGDFAVSSSTCGATLPAGTSCMVQVTFAPVAAGPRTGVLSFADNAAGSPQTTALSGVGVDFNLAPDGPVTETVSSGDSASYLLLLNSVAGVPGDAVFTCSGVPFSAVCTVSPATTPLYAAGGTVVTVTVATGQTRAGLEPPKMPWSERGLWLAFLVPGGLLLRKRRRLSMLLIGFAVLGLGGCGTVSRAIPGTGGGGGTTYLPTPSGSYTLVVAGSGGGLVRAVNLTLVVQ